ncbi:MAG: AMP-binding protein, partial [Acidobacteriota bacterium]
VAPAPSVRERLRRAFVDFSARTALVTERRISTYRDLQERVLRIAGLFRRLGAGPGDAVGLVLNSHPEDFCDARLAAIEHGTALFGIPPWLPPETMGEWLTSISPRVVLYDARLVPELPKLMARVVPGARAVAFAGPRGDYEGLLREIPARESDGAVRPEDVAAIGLTSGTTGPAKAIAVSNAAHAESCRMFLEVLRRLGASPGQSIFVGVPLFAAGGVVLAPALSAGLTLHLPDRWETARHLARIEERRMPFVFLAPSMILDLLDQPLERHDLSALRAVLYGSAAMPAAPLAEAVRRLGALFLQGYGMAECLPPVSILWPEEHGTREEPASSGTLRSAGHPVPGVAVRIDGGGEILVSSPAVMAGYWKDAPHTAERFASGWLRTGDLGAFDPEGRLHVLDRRADVILRGDVAVSPRRIQEAACEYPMVKDACAVASPATGRIVAAISLRARYRRDAEIAREALPRWLDERLPREALPEEIRLFDELPRSAQGKVLARAVRDALDVRR